MPNNMHDKKTHKTEARRTTIWLGLFFMAFFAFVLISTRYLSIRNANSPHTGSGGYVSAMDSLTSPPETSARNGTPKSRNKPINGNNGPIAETQISADVDTGLVSTKVSPTIIVENAPSFEVVGGREELEADLRRQQSKLEKQMQQDAVLSATSAGPPSSTASNSLTSSQCPRPGKRYRPQLLCVEEQNVDNVLKDQQGRYHFPVVNNNSTIWITKVTYPGALFGGPQYDQLTDEQKRQYEKGDRITSKVKTSEGVRDISWFFPTAGNIWRSDEFEKSNPPVQKQNEDMDPVRVSVKSPENDQPIAVNVKAGKPNTLDGAADFSAQIPNDVVGKGKTKYVGRNGETYDSSVIRTNQTADLVAGMFYVPTEFEPGRDKKLDSCITGFDSIGTSVIEAKSYTSCYDRPSFASAISGLISNWSHFWNCTIMHKEEACQVNYVYGLYIDSVFGSAYGCEAGQCASEFSDVMTNSLEAPKPKNKLGGVCRNVKGQAAPCTEPYFVRTKGCQVMINNRQYDVDCYWDVTLYRNEYNRQVAFAPPETVMSFPYYWSVVECVAEQNN